MSLSWSPGSKGPSLKDNTTLVLEVHQNRIPGRWSIFVTDTHYKMPPCRIGQGGKLDNLSQTLWLVGFYGISTFVGYLMPIHLYTNNQFRFKQFGLPWVHNIFVCLRPDRTWQKVIDLKVDYSGGLREGNVEHEPRLEPCLTMLVINPNLGQGMYTWL